MPTTATATASASATSGVRIDRARRSDLDVFLSLLSTTAPGEPVPPTVAQSLYPPPGPPFTHGTTLCLVARDADRQPVGALLGGIPRWVYQHELCRADRRLPLVLEHRVASIHAVALHPAHRRQGIARKLTRAAERRFRDAGFSLSVLEHAPALTGLYTRLGYHAGDSQLILAMPYGNLLGQQYETLLSAVKPLAPGVSVVTVPGAPARIVSGIIPGCHCPRRGRPPPAEPAPSQPSSHRSGRRPARISQTTTTDPTHALAGERPDITRSSSVAMACTSRFRPWCPASVPLSRRAATHARGHR